MTPTPDREADEVLRILLHAHHVLDQRGYRRIGSKTRANQHRSDRKLGKRLLPSDPRHGTHTGYVNWGCRCDLCRAWQRDRYLRGKVREEEPKMAASA